MAVKSVVFLLVSVMVGSGVLAAFTGQPHSTKIDAGGPYSGMVGSPVTFSVTVMDPSIILFRYDFNSDAIFDFPSPSGTWSTETTVVWTYSAPFRGPMTVEGWDGVSFNGTDPMVEQSSARVDVGWGTVYVSKTDPTCGGNSPCVQNITDAFYPFVNQSGTIVVFNGTYEEELAINDPVTLRGEGRDVVIVNPPSDASQIAFTDTDDVTIEGMTL
ncbi:MAG TPA: hypothetical protein VIL58_08375, partial [Thermoplasmata archaeon]